MLAHVGECLGFVIYFRLEGEFRGQKIRKSAKSGIERRAYKTPPH